MMFGSRRNGQLRHSLCTQREKCTAAAYLLDCFVLTIPFEVSDPEQVSILCAGKHLKAVKLDLAVLIFAVRRHICWIGSC